MECSPYIGRELARLYPHRYFWDEINSMLIPRLYNRESNQEGEMDSAKIIDEFESELDELKQAAFDHVQRLFDDPAFAAQELRKALRREGRI